MYPFSESEIKGFHPALRSYDMEHMEAERDRLLALIHAGKRLPYKGEGYGGYPRNLSSPFYLGSYLNSLSRAIFYNQLAILHGGEE